jgi:predicted AlkP superfamily pyrophosphatase or phosphodiesterase
MGDIDTLLTTFESGRLLRPSSTVPNLVDLARALAGLAGAHDEVATDGSSRLAGLIGAAEHLVFIVADGLGMMLMDELPASGFLPTHLVAELRTVFPSSSATALTTLATGAWPNTHGVTGQWTHLPEIGATADLLRFAARTGAKPLATLGVTVEQAFPSPALMRGVCRDTLALFPDQIVKSTSSAYLCGDHARQGYRTLAEAMEAIVTRVGAADAPTYTYLYTPWIDAEAHRYGSTHASVRTAAAALDWEVERLAARLGGRTRIVLSADHGLLDTPVVARHWLRPSADLFDLLRFPPSGDARVMYLHVREGAQDRLRRRFQERYGERFFVISVDEAEQVELFGPGPLAERARSRFGDVLVISGGADVIEYVPSGSIDRLLAITAHHSGLTPAEMQVPLVVV